MANGRMVLLLSAAVVTALVSFYPSSQATLSAPARPRQGQPSAKAGSPIGPVSSEADAAVPLDDDVEVDPFASHGWQAPPPPEAPKTVVEAAPPAPVAPPGPPPLPFKFMGRMDGDDTAPPTVYLSKGDQIVTVQGGETLDGIYKVLHVETDHVEFEHVPTGEKQILNIAANDK